MVTPIDKRNWVLSRNRAEELGVDVWEHFVIPPYYDLLALGESNKPRVIIGGRGCGKTMLLRYLSHESTFSVKRTEISDSEINHIGLYWRMDTQFSKSMHSRGVETDTWSAAFNHLCALTLGVQLLESLNSISSSNSSILSDDDVFEIDFSRLVAFDSNMPSSATLLRQYLESSLWTFETWVNDVRKVEQPLFLPGVKFITALIKLVQESILKMSEAIFFVYIDEYENLNIDQKKTINTWIKHSSPPLVFNIAMKRDSFGTRETEGGEQLSPIHDYRDFYLEEENHTDFATFAAEVLFLQMANAGFESPVSPTILRDTSKVSYRKTDEYRKPIISKANQLLPGYSEQELAEEVLDDPNLVKQLKKRINDLLKINNSMILPDAFLRKSTAQATIIIPALLSRKGNTPENLLVELDNYEMGKQSKFTKPTDWIHNNFIGCLLQLYSALGRPCPYYAGFDTFCRLAHGNLRHFLELSHRSLQESVDSGNELLPVVSIEQQASAARSASTELLRVVRTFGPDGNRLHAFVLRLGSLFALSHRRPSQSEPERNHFSIVRGKQYDDLLEEDQKFISEAVRWSVLFEESETKKKAGDIEPEVTEYVMNPIYAPYFTISYRKRRKLDITPEEAKCLIRGSYDDVKKLLRRYSRLWKVDVSSEERNLFSHLSGED